MLGVGCIIGLAGGIGASALNDSRLQAKVERQDAELAKVKRDAQTQVNALAARLGELQAQATRLNALGERLTQMGKLEDGEFDFNETPASVMATPAARPATSRSRTSTPTYRCWSSASLLQAASCR